MPPRTIRIIKNGFHGVTSLVCLVCAFGLIYDIRYTNQRYEYDQFIQDDYFEKLDDEWDIIKEKGPSYDVNDPKKDEKWVNFLDELYSIGYELPKYKDLRGNTSEIQAFFNQWQLANRFIRIAKFMRWSSPFPIRNFTFNSTGLLTRLVWSFGVDTLQPEKCDLWRHSFVGNELTFQNLKQTCGNVPYQLSLHRFFELILFFILAIYEILVIIFSNQRCGIDIGEFILGLFYVFLGLIYQGFLGIYGIVFGFVLIGIGAILFLYSLASILISLIPHRESF